MKLTEMELHAYVGWVIRVRRTELRMNIRDLSDRTGLTITSISEIERANQPSLKFRSVYKIAQALGIDWSRLFCDSSVDRWKSATSEFPSESEFVVRG